MNPDQIKMEIARLKQPSSSHETPEGVGTVRFIIRCPLGADLVLENAKCVLELVASNSFGSWPDEAEWRQILPDWFVAACAPSPSQEESDRWLKWWQGLSPQEQSEAEINKDWSLDSWLYWMEPENRQWTWWDGQVVPGCDHVLVAVEVDSWPFPWGALRWLFKASGASAVESEE
jgi:hypothetical protein